MAPVTSSELTCFQRCEREWHYRYRERRESLIPNEAISRGTRLHKRLAELWSGAAVEVDASTPPVERAMILGYRARYPQLSRARVNVPFQTEIGGVPMVGEVDALLDDPFTLIEHKSTTKDITPGSAYWREVSATSLQVSVYAAAFPGARVLYDVLKVPSLRPYKSSTKRPADETDTEFAARCVLAMSEEPEAYFQRAVVVRLEEEHRLFAQDVSRIVSRMRVVHDLPARTPGSCFKHGRECDFFGVCWRGDSLAAHPQRRQNHSEEVAERAAKS